MIKRNKTTVEIREQIRKGLDLSFKRLIKQKALSGGVLVLSKNGKIVKVKATDLDK